MERMTSASPIFVRCLKPNHVKSPGNFDQKYIQEQVFLLTLCILIDSSFWSVTVDMEWSIVKYLGVSGYNLKIYRINLSEDLFTITNSVDPEEMEHFIWVFTDCKSTHLGVSHIQKG